MEHHTLIVYPPENGERQYPLLGQHHSLRRWTRDLDHSPRGLPSPPLEAAHELHLLEAPLHVDVPPIDLQPISQHQCTQQPWQG